MICQTKVILFICNLINYLQQKSKKTNLQKKYLSISKMKIPKTHFQATVCHFRNLALMICIISIGICQNDPVDSIFRQTDILAAGKITITNDKLVSAADGIQQYQVPFTGKSLTQSKRLQAMVSLMSFECYTSYQFSFNTTVLSLSLTSMSFSVEIFGNSYFTMLAFNYAAMGYNFLSSGTDASDMIYHECFLCTNLTADKGTHHMMFQKSNLNGTNDQNRYNSSVFMAGVQMKNLYQNNFTLNLSVEIGVGSEMIYNRVQKYGNLTVKWVCTNTVVIDTQLAYFKQPLILFNSQQIQVQLDEQEFDNQSSIFDSTNLSTKNKQNTLIFGIKYLNLTITNNETQLLNFSYQDAQKGDIKLKGVKTIFFGLYIAEAECGASNNYFFKKNYYCYTTCPPQTYVHDQHSICLDCHYSCYKCSGPNENNCQQCDENTTQRNYNSNNNTCPCKDGYFDNNTKVCAKCDEAIPYCQKCDSSTNCIKCINDLSVTTGGTKCQCSGQGGDIYLSRRKWCWPFPGCSRAGVSFGGLCTECEQGKHLQLVQSTCQCEQNFTLNPDLDSYTDLTQIDICVPVCGDGIFTYQDDENQQCDDNNSNGGDGCNPECQIESGFGCQSTVFAGPSICAPLRSIKLMHLYSERILYQNSVRIVFRVTETDAKVQLSSKYFNLTCFSSSFPFDLTKISQTSYVPQQSLLKLTLSYNQTIQGTNHDMMLAFDPKVLHTENIGLTNFKFEGINLQLTYDQHLSMIGTINMLSIIVSSLSVLVFFVLNFLNQKQPATELLLSSQTVFFGTLSAGNNAWLAAINSLKYINGFNDLGVYSLSLDNYQIGLVLPNQLFNQFILNFNWMGAVFILSIFLGMLFKLNVQRKKKAIEDINGLIFESQLAEKLSENQAKNNAQKQLSSAVLLQKRYINKILYPICLICLLQVYFFFALQVYSARINNNFSLINPSISIVAALVCLMMCQGFMNYMYEQKQNPKPIFDFTKQLLDYPYNLISLHIVVMITYIIVILSNKTLEYSLFTLLAGNIGILVFRIAKNPYQSLKSLSFLDGLFKSLTIIVSLGTLVMITLSLNGSNAMYFCLGIVILMLVNTVVSIIRCLLELYWNPQQLHSDKNNDVSDRVSNIEEKQNQTRQNEEEEQEEDDESENEDEDEDQAQLQEINKKYKGRRQALIDKEKERKKEKVKKGKKAHRRTQSIQYEQLNMINQIRNRNQQQVYAQNQLANDDEPAEQDQLARVKRRLREDIKRKRGEILKVQPNHNKKSL